MSFEFDENIDSRHGRYRSPEKQRANSKIRIPQIQPKLSPEGYQLNKLRREARAPPFEHLNLAVSLNQTRPKLPPNSEPTGKKRTQAKTQYQHIHQNQISRILTDMPGDIAPA